MIFVASGLQAQERRYLFELGGAASFQSYSNDTGLESSFGGLGRLGIWLPLNFSAEVEGSLAKSNGINVKLGSASLLYNLLLGSSTWAYLKAGIGGTKYGPGGDECQTEYGVRRQNLWYDHHLCSGRWRPFPSELVDSAPGRGGRVSEQGHYGERWGGVTDTSDVSFSNFGAECRPELHAGQQAHSRQRCRRSSE